MIHGKTKSGFEFDIPEENLDNIELMEELVNWKRGDRMASVPAVRQLLGEKGKKALYDHCRDATGRSPASLVLAEALEIIAIVDASSETGKNS